MSRLYLSKIVNEFLTYLPKKPKLKLESKKNLSGQNILITRAGESESGTDRLAQLIAEYGGNPIHHPVIRLSLIDTPHTRELLRQINQFRTLVFVSSNGVEFFGQLTRELGIQFTGLESCAAIGKGTAMSLYQLGIGNVSICPESNSRKFAHWLNGNSPDPYVVFRADRGSDVLAKQLSQFNRDFTEVPIYASSDVKRADPKVKKQLSVGKIDWVTLTSSAIANSAIKLFGELLHQTKIATIGRQVSAKVEELGHFVDAEAEEANFESLLAAIANHHKKQ